MLFSCLSDLGPKHTAPTDTVSTDTHTRNSRVFPWKFDRCASYSVSLTNCKIPALFLGFRSKNHGKKFRKMAITFLFVGRFLRSIRQMKALDEYFKPRWWPLGSVFAFGFKIEKTDFLVSAIFQKPRVQIYPIFFSDAWFHMKRAAILYFFSWGQTTYS